MSNKSQRGSAIFILFVAVALFAALAFAFMQSSRTSTGWLENEATKAKATQNSINAQAINTAVKRLKLRGCTDAQISYETPKGNNPNPSAPTDKRCHVYRIEGGGVQFAGADTVLTPTNCATTGQICAEGFINIGTTVGGARLYIASADAGANVYWATTRVRTYTTSDTDGKTNTATLVAMTSGNPYPAAVLCDVYTEGGFSDWYLPAEKEFNAAYNNRAQGSITSFFTPIAGVYYWSSSEVDLNYATRVTFTTPGSSGLTKTALLPSNVRCARHD